MSEAVEGSTLWLLKKIQEASMRGDEKACRVHWEALKEHPDQCRLCYEWVRDHCRFSSLKEEARWLLDPQIQAAELVFATT